MLTIDGLKAFGADTQNGLERCMNNEAFYLKLVTKCASDTSCEKLKEAISAGDLNAAFETAHSMKGVYGNLALTPLYESVSEITELLRAGTQTDYAPYVAKITEKFEELKKMSE